jgi:hypothetical protein
MRYLLFILILAFSFPAEASLQYLFPTDCANLDEKTVDDGDTTSDALTTTPKECALENLTGTGYEIGRVSVVSVAKNTSGTPDVEIGVKIGGTIYECARYAGSDNADPYLSYGCDWESSPDSATDWTVSEINAMSITIAESGADVIATQLYAVVDTDEETDDHTGVLLPESYVKNGISNKAYGHAWWHKDAVDSAGWDLSPADGDEIFLWERVGSEQDEGYYMGIFSLSTDCDTADTDEYSVAFRYQPQGDRYEVQMSCPTTQNVPELNLIRYVDGTPTTVVANTAVTGANVAPSKNFAILIKVENVADPIITVDFASDDNNGVDNTVFTHTDTNAAAIEESGRWGFRIVEDGTNAIGGALHYPLFNSTFGIVATDLTTSYSLRLLDFWGQTVATQAESSGTAVISWQGFEDMRYQSAQVGAVQTFPGTLQVLDGSNNVVADTGLLFGPRYGQTWSFKSTFKLRDYRLGSIEDSSVHSNQRKLRLWYQLDRPGTVTVTCSPSCSNNSDQFTYADDLAHKQDEYVQVIEIDNLDENTSYTYSILVDAVEEGTGSFNSGPLNSEDVQATTCFSSCISNRGSPNTVADTIGAAQECDFFVLNGDVPYVDGGNEIYTSGAMHHAAFHEVAAMYKTYRLDTNWRDLFHTMPVLFQLNDHEICNNYSQGAEDGDLINGFDGHFAFCEGFPVEVSEEVYKLYSHYGNPDSPTTGKYWYKLEWGQSSHYFTDPVLEREDNQVTEDFGAWYGEVDATVVTLTNGDFEAGTTTGWSCIDSGGGACASFTADAAAHSGSFAGRFYETGTTDDSLIEQAITVDASKKYKISAWVFVEFATDVAELRVSETTGHGGTLSCSTAHSGTVNTWEQLTCIVPDTNADTSLFVQVWSTYGSSSRETWADDLTITYDIYTDTEDQPTCSRNGGDLSQLDCTGETFTTGSPAFNTAGGEAMALFDGTWYIISSVVDADTLDMTEDISCSSCTAQTARILKDMKTSHSGVQYQWLFNEWRADTNPIQFYWASYPLWGHRHENGIYKYDVTDTFIEGYPFPPPCAVNEVCGYGFEHDFLVDELEVLEASGTGKQVLIPVGDEHSTRLSQWNSLDIYELFISGLGAWNGAERHPTPVEKETDYPGLSVVADGGGQPNYGKIDFDTAAETWDVEVRNDEEQPELWWDGTNLAVGTAAWFSAPRGLDATITANNYPEWLWLTSGTQVVRMASGYCWKIGNEYDNSNATILRRTGDTDCKDWTSASAYTFELDAGTNVNQGGASIVLTSDEAEIMAAYYSAPGVGQLKECTFTGSPPTISSCSTPTSDPDYETAQSLVWDSNGYLFLSAREATNATDVMIANATSADSREIGALFQVSDDADAGPHMPKLVKMSGDGDMMVGWWTRDTDKYRTSLCSAGGDNVCASGEWAADVLVFTDTNVAYTHLSEWVDIASLADDTAVLTYITAKNANVDERSQLKYAYYSSASWGSVTEIPDVGWRLHDAQVFTGGSNYYIAVIDETTDKIVLLKSADGTTWAEVSAPFESAMGKAELDVSQLDANNVAVTYLSITDSNNIVENDQYSVWGQQVTEIWTHSEGRWRIKNVNPHINPRINTIN